MGRKKAQPADHDVEARGATDEGQQPADQPEEAEVAGKGDVEIAYLDHNGQHATRIFSKQVHGPDFKKLAEEFKANPANRIVK